MSLANILYKEQALENVLICKQFVVITHDLVAYTFFELAVKQLEMSIWSR